MQAAPATPQVAVTAEVVRIYLDELRAEAAAQGLNPDTLVLGCTHYPLLKPVIERVRPAGIRVIDSAESTAEQARHASLSATLAHRPNTLSADPILRCFATDSVEKFERLGSRFLGRPVGNVATRRPRRLASSNQRKTRHTA